MKQVVTLQEIEAGIYQMTMHDRVNKNAFSPELINDLAAAFAQVNNDNTCKVLILTGYDSYFATGGTQQALMTLQQGNGAFTDANVYSLALECEVPVIAAMQGHAIGGGFVMGLYADFVVLGKECVYTTNFMKYGFTPGMGATLVVPKKLGVVLGHEMLFCANTYRGQQLKERGVAFPVVPKHEVLDQALELARQLAEKPRIALVTLKKHLVSPIASELNAVIEQELAMHEKTFHQAEVKQRIKDLF